MITRDLGMVTAYAYAVSKGYTGTEAQFAELMASYATVAQDAQTAAQSAAADAAAAAASKAEVTAEGATQVAAVQAKGTEVLGSIPADYTALSEEVSSLSSAIHSDEYLPTWVGGWIDSANGGNVNTYPTVRIRTNNYIDLDTGLAVEFVGSKTVKTNAVLYDADQQYIAAYWANTYIGTDASKKIYTQDDFQKDYPTAKYIRFAFGIYPEETIDTADAEDWIVMHTGIFYGEQLITSRSIESNKTGIDGLVVSEKGYIHIANAGIIRTTVNSDATISLAFWQKLIVCFNNAFRTTLDWSDISTNIASYITISGNSATITIPTYRSLVLNLDDLKLYFRSNDTVESDFVIISNGAYLPQGWAVDMENYQLRLTSDTVIEREGTSKYETFTQSVLQNQCQRFSATLLDVEHCESFLFYTDPHTMGNLYSLNKLNTYQVFNAVLKYYEATPTDFVICGGDWLDNSDTLEQAAFKLGFIKGSVKNTAPTYLLVGNHDTNYQGTERLSNQSMKTLWYEGKPTYYRFKGRETAFYCFDTGIENQDLAEQDNLGYEQATWFATSLLTESEAHTVVCMHILYYTLSPLSIQPLAQAVLDIAKAYNDRDTITVNGQTFNFSNVSGKVELLIAGHTHVDGTYTINGIPCVVTRNTWIPSNSTWAFDLMSIDYDNRKVNVIRAGTNGTDRTIALA